MSFILLGILNAQAAGGAGGAAYELIESQVLSSSAASVTFSSIPQDYKHLQIRFVARTNTTGFTGTDVFMEFNSSTSGYYKRHSLLANGSSVSSNGDSTSTHAHAGYIMTDFQPANIFGTSVIDLLDYSNSSKNTTVRGLNGYAQSGYNFIQLFSSLWNNTAAVTSVKLDAIQGDFVSGCRFSLYGIRG